MSYVYIVLSCLIALLAIGAVVWYIVSSSAKAKAAVGAIEANSDAKDAKIKSLDDRIIDSEYKRRLEEKTRNEKIVSDGDADAATQLLHDATKDLN